MPSTRPCAAFEPISPDFDVKALVESTPNFEWVVRIHCDMIEVQGIEAFEKLVLIHVILGGKPLVVEGYEGRLDRWTFTVQWLRDNLGSKVENPRDLTKKATVPMTFAHYLNHMDLLTNQWTPHNYKDTERQRIYLKDIDCPPLWHDKLKTILPPFLYYLNDTTGDFGGFGAVDEPDPTSSGSRRGKGIGKAGDLMSCLPKEMRAENMMCYIGHEGTYTPSHREMCASLGHNIMVEASTGRAEDGKPTKPGSSLWFMTESKERAVVAEYWLSKLGHDIEIENHFAQINAWKTAPFKTYVVEQKPGDFILIPPLAPHQVWNRGTRTMKAAWNRTTVETLELALTEALPNARMVCRDEQYKNKAMIYFALQKYSKILRAADKFKQRQDFNTKQKSDMKVRQLEKDFRRLHGLYTRVLVSESFLPQQQEKPEMIPFEAFITCSYCRANIFNRFLTCPSCVVDHGEGEQDTYDVCMDCYAMGRSCACISKLRWVEQFPWTELTQKHDQWRQQIIGYEGKITEKSPMTLKVEMLRLGKQKTLAQICQLELKRRPWRDIKKPPPQVEGVKREEEVELDINGNVKKTKKKVRRSEKFVRDHSQCHIDKRWEPKWKQATCTQCDKSWCYGLLFRGFDIKPQDTMVDPDWKCPSCQKICGCRECRKKPGYTPYSPATTYLGNDTRAIADPRSVESLVDFSCSNIAWIQKAGDDHGDDTSRLRRRRNEADAEQARFPELGEEYAEMHVDERDQEDDVDNQVLRLAQHEGIPVDPALATLGTRVSPTDSINGDEDIYEENPEGPTDRLRGLTSAPYIVPAGGIIRDSEHAYDLTEAITYDYPDPEVNVPSREPMPEVSGYGLAVPDSPGDTIEMVNRKRKRNKVDEGDKAFTYNKKIPSTTPKQPEKAKKRQSLIVKLSINKEKLAGINKMAIIAQRALNGVNGPAPVIGSDLQALNMTPSSEAQSLSKKARTEHIRVDHDDEFTVSRRRDRRKVQTEVQDAEITRRTTRQQAVTYEEPDEDEFNDAIARPTSKLATMEHAIVIDSEDDDSHDQASKGTSEAEDEGHANRSEPDPMDVDEIVPEIPPKATTLNRPTATLQPKLSTQPSKRLDTSTASPTSSSATGPRNDLAKTLANARANRKAKLAALEWMEHDSEDLEDDWSGEDRNEDQASPSDNDQPRKARSITRDTTPAVSVSNDASSTVAVSSQATKPSQPATISRQTRPRESLPLAPSIPETQDIVTQRLAAPAEESPRSEFQLKATAMASAADWGDSDSDSEDRDVDFSIEPAKSVRVSVDVPLYNGRGYKWSSINGRGRGAARGVSIRGASRGTSLSRGAQRGRGRPRGRGLKVDR